ncbi:MAG TPA: molybdenum ABC transporter ATP-binding protein [Rudaea sp.]|nr:molybdenum ABC transporter ATP-binding protein [Rudaea sp.]
MSGGIRARFSIAYAGFRLDVDLQLPASGISALFGPSGSGKTTCLRAIAGLERPRGGYLSVNDEVWQDDAGGIFVPTHRRALGYVFQEASLFPHLSVRANLEYGLRRAGGDGKLQETADLLGIGSLLDRSPERLSGGERQRVAIARALLTRPRLLLLDEPLASLDLQRRQEILPYLERLHDELKIPSIYVSHMPDEVARLADYLVLLDNGAVVASGPLQETLARLDLPATFTDNAGVFIEATLTGHDDADDLTRLDFAGGTIYAPRRPQPIGGKVRCRIEARDVSLTLHKQTGTSILNIIPAVVVDMAPTEHAAQVLVRLDAAGTPLLARITRRSWNTLGLAPGSHVWAQVKTVVLIG